MKANNSIVLAIIVGAVIIGGGIFYASQTTKTGATVIEKNGQRFVVEPVEVVEPVTLTIVSDKNCENCETKKIEAWLKKQLGGPLAVRRLDYSATKGKKILDQYNGSYLPFLLLGDEVEKKENLRHLKMHVITKVKDRYLVDLEKIGAPIGRYLDVANYKSDDPTAPKIVIAEKEQNLGEVKLSGGTVQTEFTIKNEGQNPLVFLGLNTSCGCTSAKVITPDGESPVYQMAGHGKSVKWRGELAPGIEGKIVVFYDPSVHPDLKGDVMREIYIKTNDPNTPQETIRLLVSQNPN